MAFKKLRKGSLGKVLIFWEKLFQEVTHQIQAVLIKMKIMMLA